MIKARVIALKTAERNLKPGDLFSEEGPEYWSRVMFDGKLPSIQVYIRTNDTQIDPGPDRNVYKLTVALEDGSDTRNKHVIESRHDPFAPPGMAYGDYMKRRIR